MTKTNHAEGLPISGNHLTCKKLTITLTKPQLQQAKARKQISPTPAQSALFLKQVPLTEKQPDIDPLTKEELDLAISKIVPHYRPLFTCLTWTEARPNELFALRWKDIEFNRGEIRINKGRVRGSEDLPKTASM